MPEDIFPEINIPVVSVIWQYTGLSVPEMEQRVTTYGQYSISANVTAISVIRSQRRLEVVVMLHLEPVIG